MNIHDRIDMSIKMSIIDLKSSGKEVVSLFEVLRNSLEFIDKTDTKMSDILEYHRQSRKSV